MIYGAGVIGSLYAVLFAETGYDTSIYARGKRLEFLKKNRLLYKKNQFSKILRHAHIPYQKVVGGRSKKGSGRRKIMKEKVNVTGVPETMVQTLYARAKETKKQNAKIKDEIAVELVEKLDYDFSIADKDNAMNYGVIARTIVLDWMVEQYLKKHENTVVVNIACGLDTRCYRMKGKYLRWYNVDLPEAMPNSHGELRMEKNYKESYRNFLFSRKSAWSKE